MHGMTEALKAGTALPPGVYFNLDETRYHEDPALGSTDHRNLLTDPTKYWWFSPFNKFKVGTDTRARTRGTATHVFVLQGEEEFGRRYARGPTQDEGATPAQKSARTKAAKERLDAEGLGRTMIQAEEYDRIVLASAMIASDPELVTAFKNGVPEVSVFWTKGNVRLKARFDYLKPRGIGDLKTITNLREIPFEQACLRMIETYGYLQAEHYLEARHFFARLAADGLVHGDHDPDLLKRIGVETRYAFQFVFLSAKDAPTTCSLILSTQNPLLEKAREGLEVARRRYERGMAEFGPDTPWVVRKKPREVAIEEMSSYWARWDEDE